MAIIRKVNIFFLNSNIVKIIKFKNLTRYPIGMLMIEITKLNLDEN